MANFTNEMFDLIFSNIEKIVCTKLKDKSAFSLCCCNTSLLGYYKVLYKNGIKSVYVSPMFIPHIKALTIKGNEIVLTENQWAKYVKRLLKYSPTGELSLKELKNEL